VEERTQRTKAQAELKKLEEQLTKQEEGYRQVQGELEALQESYKKTLVYFKSRQRKLDQKQDEVVASNHELQQLVCNLRKSNR